MCRLYSEKHGASILAPLTGQHIPPKGDFLAVVGNRAAQNFLDLFEHTARAVVADLSVVSYAVPLSGYILPQIRFSDHASFWERGYPAIMLNDTVMFRNPNYHTPHDTWQILDFRFLLEVTRAVVGFSIAADRAV